MSQIQDFENMVHMLRFLFEGHWVRQSEESRVLFKEQELDLRDWIALHVDDMKGIPLIIHWPRNIV